MFKLLNLLVLFLFLQSCAPDGNQSPGLCMIPQQASAMASLAQVLGTPLLIRLKDSSAKNFMKSLNLQKIDENLYRVETRGGPADQALIESSIESGDIQFLEPDYQVQLVQNSNLGWSHSVVHSENAWKLATGKNILVAVIDTGVDFNDANLKGHFFKNKKEVQNEIDDDGNGLIDDISGWDFAAEDSKPQAEDLSLHGNHVARILLEHAPDVQVLPLKYMDEGGLGSTSNAIRAIDYAVKMGARIINASWGSFVASSALQSAIARAEKAGVLFVAAAGNGDPRGQSVNLDETGFYPASYPEENILSVAATDAKDALAPWSNFGRRSVDVAAPGVEIDSLSGTSMAAPIVSSLAALVWDLRPELSFQDVKLLIGKGVSAVPGLQNKLSFEGRVDFDKTISISQSWIPRESLNQEGPQPRPSFKVQRCR